MVAQGSVRCTSGVHHELSQYLLVEGYCSDRATSAYAVSALEPNGSNAARENLPESCGRGVRHRLTDGNKIYTMYKL